jgi:hypothetical protein
MKTTIDNNSRVFMIVRSGFFTRSYIVNLEEIPNILKNELEINDSFEISEVFNFKFKKCSKKHLNSMFESAKIDFKI